MKKSWLFFPLIVSIVALTYLFSVKQSLAQIDSTTNLSTSTVTCTDYIVKSNDWLSKIADNFYQDPSAYQQIAEATNAKAKVDSSYAQITATNILRVGWKLCIPSGNLASQSLVTNTAKSSIKVGFIYVGPVGDKGWTDAHNEARLYLTEKLGNQVQTTFKANVNATNAETEIRALAQQGNDLIFTTSYDFMDATEKVAKEFPQIKFVHISGYKKAAPNFSNLFGSMEQMKYIAGMVAGAKTKAAGGQLVGYIAPIVSPEVTRLINATALGMKETCSDCKLKVIWINSWFNPSLETQSATGLLNEGVIVLVSDTDSSSASVSVANDAGKWAVAYDSESACNPSTTACLGSPYWNWKEKYLAIVQTVLNGTFKVEDSYLGAETGIVNFSGLMTGQTASPSIPTEALPKIKERLQQMLTGTFTRFDIFKGTIRDNKGNVIVSDNQPLTQSDLEGLKGVNGREDCSICMNWLADNIIGELPQLLTTSVAKSSIKVGFIYVGPVGDKGWTDAHNEARLYLTEKLGSQVQTTFKANVNATNAESEIRALAQQGNDLIFTTSYDFMDATEKVAKEFPQIKFVHISGYKKATPNFSNLFGSMEQMKYIAGMVAGAKAKVEGGQLVGYIAPIVSPEVTRLINATALGMKETCPNCKLKVIWINSWFNPSLETQSATELLNEGVTVLVSDTDSSSASVSVASDAGKWAVAYDSESACNPSNTACLGSPYWNWKEKYLAIVQTVLNGTFKVEDSYLGAETGIVNFSGLMTGQTPSPSIPTEALPKIKERLQQMLTGTFTRFDIFKGTIRDNKGNVIVSDNQPLTQSDLEGLKGVVGREDCSICMNWLADNVVGELSQ